jgi:hypothetical protein
MRTATAKSYFICLGNNRRDLGKILSLFSFFIKSKHTIQSERLLAAGGVEL